MKIKEYKDLTMIQDKIGLWADAALDTASSPMRSISRANEEMAELLTKVVTSPKVDPRVHGFDQEIR